MMRHPRPYQSDNKKALRVFQANVGKISPAHDCALALADSERYDIVLHGPKPRTTDALPKLTRPTTPSPLLIAGKTMTPDQEL